MGHDNERRLAGYARTMSGITKFGLILFVTGIIALLVDWLRPQRHIIPVPWNWIISGALLIVGLAIILLSRHAS